jgi:RecG-like helicase
VPSWTQRLFRPAEVEEATALGAVVSREDAQPIEQCQRGRHARVCGTVRSIAVRPECVSPSLEVEIYDGSGHLTIVWTGRRLIRGIEVGRRLVAEGRLTCPDGHIRMYNPEYRLLPRDVS